MVSTPVASAPMDLVTTAVLDLLNDAQEGRKVYDGAYSGDPTTPAYPYGILYRIAGGTADPMPDLDADPQTVTVAYQVTAVSNLRNQCEATARLFHDRLLARDDDGWRYPIAAPDGWAVVDRRPDPAMPGVDRTGDPPRVVYSLPARYLLTVSPIT